VKAGRRVVHRQFRLRESNLQRFAAERTNIVIGIIHTFQPMVGGQRAAGPGPEKTMGIITAAGAKDPSDPTWGTDAEIKAYRDFIKEYLPDGDPTNGLVAPGYEAGIMFAEALRRCGDDLTRAHLVDVVTHLRGVHLPGLFAGASNSSSCSAGMVRGWSHLET
jgi:hypothetical protein